jgi:hypothetical protein
MGDQIGDYTIHTEDGYSRMSMIARHTYLAPHAKHGDAAELTITCGSIQCSVLPLSPANLRELAGYLEDVADQLELDGSARLGVEGCRGLLPNENAGEVKGENDGD